MRKTKKIFKNLEKNDIFSTLAGDIVYKKINDNQAVVIDCPHTMGNSTGKIYTFEPDGRVRFIQNIITENGNLITEKVKLIIDK